MTATSDLGDIYIIETAGDLTIYQVGTGTAYTAFILGPERIINGRTDGGSNVSSGKTRLFAGDDIGTEANPLQTAVGFLEGLSIDGAVWIANAGALTVGGLTEDKGIVAKGPVSLDASSPITVEKDIYIDQEGANITLTAHDDDNDTPGNRDDIVVKSGVSVIAEHGSVILQAGDDVIIEDGALVQAGGATLDLSADIPAGSGQAALNAADEVIRVVSLSGEPQAGETWALTVGGITYEHIVAGGENLAQVAEILANRIDATDGLTAWVEGIDRIAITRTGVILRFDYENLDPDVGGTPKIYGTLIGTSALIEGSSDDDYFPLAADLFHGITGPVTLTGHGGSDRYEIELQGSGSSRINVTDRSLGDPNGTDRLLIFVHRPMTIFLLFRPNAISAIEVDENRDPVPGGGIERIN